MFAWEITEMNDSPWHPDWQGTTKGWHGVSPLLHSFAATPPSLHDSELKPLLETLDLTVLVVPVHQANSSCVEVLYSSLA